VTFYQSVSPFYYPRERVVKLVRPMLSVILALTLQHTKGKRKKGRKKSFISLTITPIKRETLTSSSPFFSSSPPPFVEWGEAKEGGRGGVLSGLVLFGTVLSFEGAELL